MKYEIKDGYITGYWNDKTGLSIRYVNDSSIKDLYIIGSNPQNRAAIEEPKDAEVFEPNPIATKIVNINYNKLTADVIGQYGEKMNVDVEFMVDGTGARIEDGKIIEDVFDNDTSYFIVAKYGDLEERQEKTIYAPRPVEPNEMGKLSERQEMTESALAELMMMIPILTGGGDL